MNEPTGQEPVIRIHCIRLMFYLSNLKTIMFLWAFLNVNVLFYYIILFHNSNNIEVIEEPTVPEGKFR